MLKDKGYTYFIEKNKNCAEAVLLAANDFYGLDANESAIKALGAFGGGIASGSICGAAAGAAAAIGLKYNTGSAHESPEMKKKLMAFMQDFNAELGSDLCRDLKPKYFNPPQRCNTVVDTTLDILQRYM